MTKAEVLTKVLDLKHLPVGVKFISFEDQFAQCPVSQLEKKTSVCGMARFASEGNCFKAKQENFGCDYGMYALGVGTPPRGIDAGEAYARCGLYDSYATAHEVMGSFRYCSHKAYGVVMGPVDEVEQPDVVVLFGTAEQCMRLMQGYAYHLGVPKNLCTVGNQAMCSDLIAKPFSNNDINLSLMCRGARAIGRFEPGEMGIGIPYQKFEALVDGVVNTVNPVSTNEVKDGIEERLQSDTMLGVRIQRDMAYGSVLSSYGKYVKEQLEKGGSDC